MKTIFDNLYLYEIVLLFLGVFLFIILCAGLVYYIVKNNDVKKLLYFFIIPIIMIAYPSIQEIQVANDKVAIVKYKEEVSENPNDTVAVKNLEEVTKKLEKRASTTQDLASVAEGYLILENHEKVNTLADKAIEMKENELATSPPSSEGEPPVKDTVGNSTIKTLNSYKQIATFQEDLKTNRISPQDTALIKERVNRINVSNPTTKQFIDRKYLGEPISKQPIIRDHQ